MKARPEKYRAPWWLPGGHLQTIAAAFAPAPRIPWRRERWETPDGDFVDLDWAEPGESAATGPLLALFHGLEGSSSSHYARALAAQALAAGWRCVVPHFRGCSGELNRLPRAYHSGDSAEIRWILERLETASAPAGVLNASRGVLNASRGVLNAPRGVLYAAGVSLGGNALLKYLGEQGTAARISRAVAVSAPLDLAAAGRALDRGLSRAIYTRMFLKTLKKKSIAKLDRHPGLFDAARLRRARTFWEYDDTFTAPVHGFLGADDYWMRSSSAPWLARIRVPALVLNARNDPFLPAQALDAVRGRDIPSNVTLEFPHTGGHAGFPGRGQWLARRTLAFLAET